MVHRNIKKSLDLLGMKIKRQDAIWPGCSQQIGDQLGGDRYPRLIFAVLPSVTEVRNYGRDPIGAGPTGGIDQDQQLH